MRWLILLLLFGCGDSEERCDGLKSDFINHPGTISSGRAMIGVTWRQEHSPDGSITPPLAEHRATLVFADGSISPGFITQGPLRATVANETVLWSPVRSVASTFCGGGSFPLDFRLQHRTGAVERVIPAWPQVQAHAAVFDGQSHQLFWLTTGGSLEHRSLAEDGTLGPLQVLQAGVPGNPCLDAASDGAGVTVMQLGPNVELVDTTTGALTRVFTGVSNASYDPVFWFAGEFHIRYGGQLLSFNTAGTARTRNLVGALKDTLYIVPADQKLYFSTPSAVVEVDADLAILRGRSPSFFDIGSLGPDLVRFWIQPADAERQMPGRIELVRDDVLRTDLVVDSPLRRVEGCEII